MQPAALIETSASRTALAGFFLSGLLFGFPGAILPAWGYHVRPHYVTIGNYFLAINVGLLASVLLSRMLPRARRPSLALAVACASAFVSLIWLSFTAPPVAESWRLGGFFGLGLGAGALNTGILHAISSAYRLEPAATINLAGAFFGLGSALVALLIAGVFDVYTVSTILLLVAIAPALFAVAFAKAKFPSDVVARRRSFEDVAREFTIPSAVLFSLLLFFHFGNEWAISGWLALFLILRLGMNPSTALLLLAAYWISLMLGRVVAQFILPRVHHAKLLVGAGFASMFGCIILTFTDNLFGAIFGTLLVGFGFAPIYPLVVENIRARFPHFHPGFFNGIFSLALTGGMLAPASLGYAAEVWGIGIVMMLPMIGSIIVCVLVLVIWLESKLILPKL